MKRAISVIMSALMLTACAASRNESASAENTGAAEAVTTSATLPEGFTSDSGTPLFTFEEIADRLNEFSEFSYSYLECKAFMMGENLDKSDSVSGEDMGAEQDIYYRVTGGDYLTYSALTEAAESFCTENMIDELGLMAHYYCAGPDDELYLWRYADSNGGYLGIDEIVLDKLEYTDSGIIVRFIAYGDGENWDHDDIDWAARREITMVYEDGKLKIDKCGLNEYSMLTWIPVCAPQLNEE